ncbi:hypothetical protein Nepgr_033120 [Nepenthes gracilis]|uniref:Uncharacterized protein n=1 Tax=Nepenthes gracilis TaxID=150966 RepID=A0AAD3TM44_NEPGR|nr:hypothetical protein Nepgr_033120 [Nepenthes gracilis]
MLLLLYNGQNAVVQALKHFIPAYLQPTDDKGIHDITSKYLEELSDSNVTVRRGFALALGVFPSDFLAKAWKDVFSKLSSSCAIEENLENQDAEARVNAAKGLVSVCKLLTASRKLPPLYSGEDSMPLFLVIKNVVMRSLFETLDDYCVDN